MIMMDGPLQAICYPITGHTQNIGNMTITRSRVKVGVLSWATLRIWDPEEGGMEKKIKICGGRVREKIKICRGGPQKKLKYVRGGGRRKNKNVRGIREIFHSAPSGSQME